VWWCVAFLALGLSRAHAGQAGILETKTFRISIEVRCEEGEVTCDNVKYVGTNKKTGEALELTGKTAHHLNKEGNPGRFLGCIFKNKDVTYFLSEDGLLRVTKGDEVVLEENGTWSWDDGAGDSATDSHKKADAHQRQ
jgi:hypothetical protein